MMPYYDLPHHNTRAGCGEDHQVALGSTKKRRAGKTPAIEIATDLRGTSSGGPVAAQSAVAQYHSNNAVESASASRRLKPRLEGVPPRSPPKADWEPSGRSSTLPTGIPLFERYCAVADSNP
jgi:hypothetical protein